MSLLWNFGNFARLAFLRFTCKLDETAPFRRWLRVEPAFALLTPGEMAEFTVSVFVDRLTARVRLPLSSLLLCLQLLLCLKLLLLAFVLVDGAVGVLVSLLSCGLVWFDFVWYGLGWIGMGWDGMDVFCGGGSCVAVIPFCGGWCVFVTGLYCC